MNERTTALLRLGAGQLAAIVGMLHLWLGIRQWSRYVAAGIYLPRDVRVPLWTISGVAILVAIAIVALEDLSGPVAYGGGIAVSLVYILGYYSWHLGGHRSFFIGGTPKLHDSGPIEFVLDHTFAGPVAFFALLTEAALLVTLVVLLRTESS